MAGADDSGVSLSNLDHSALSDSTPLVFQCSNCNSVVGDSLSWVSANKIMRTIALSGVSVKVGVKKEIAVASSGRDEGSTYRDVYCLECNETLGKKYIASSPDIDTLRGLYSLSVEKLNSYKVGSYESNNNNNLADMMSCPSPNIVWRQVTKIKYLLVSINERLNAVETKLSREERQETCHDQITKDAAETDSRDTESVSSTENISSRISYTSDSEAKVSRQGRKDADSNDDTTNRFVDQKERPRNRTPLSPRNISNQSKPGGRGDGSEFNVPLPDNGDRLYIGQKGRQRIRTPLSPRNNSNQSRQMERDDTSEFNVPLPDQGDRRSVGPKGQRSKRTPLSPRNISNQSSHVERDDASEFIAPLPEKGTRNMRNRRQLSESRSGSRVQRQCNYQDSEQGEELEGDSSRMETWPYDERGEGLKKRKRLASP